MSPSHYHYHPTNTSSWSWPAHSSSRYITKKSIYLVFPFLILITVFKHHRSLLLGIRTVQDQPVIAGHHERSLPTRSFPIIDILSTGSVSRPEYLIAQEEYLRRSAHVRHIFQVTEHNDTEKDCHTRLTWDQVKNISDHCRAVGASPQPGAPILGNIARHYNSVDTLKAKSNPVGWICAQKRPLTAFWQVMKDYHYDTFPDYLVIMDDDTWLHMDRFVSYLTREYSPNVPYMIAGCRFLIHNDIGAIPYGGVGMIYTKAALELWTKPLIGCNPFRYDQSTIENGDHYVRSTCDRFHNQHRLGETILPNLFASQDTPTLLDIFHSYVHRANYTDVSNWDTLGFCLHSDWAFAYFATEYRVTLDGKIQDFLNSTVYNGWYGECNHLGGKNCDENATICHYLTPDDMRTRMRKLM